MTTDWKKRVQRKAIIFDLDGTLVDTAPDLTRALNFVLTSEGAQPVGQQKVRAMVGQGARKLIELGFAAAGKNLSDPELDHFLAKYLDYYSQNIAHDSVLFPNALETLMELKAAGCRLSVCTNKSTALSEQLLRALEIRAHFAAVIGGDFGGERKPHPAHILATVAKMDAAPEDAVMVGDSINDVEAARAAGIPVIVVSFGYTAIAPTALGADQLIDNFRELPAALTRIS